MRMCWGGCGRRSGRPRSRGACSRTVPGRRSRGRGRSTGRSGRGGSRRTSARWCRSRPNDSPRPMAPGCGPGVGRGGVFGPDRRRATACGRPRRSSDPGPRTVPPSAVEAAALGPRRVSVDRRRAAAPARSLQRLATGGVAAALRVPAGVAGERGRAVLRAAGGAGADAGGARRSAVSAGPLRSGGGGRRLAGAARRGRSLARRAGAVRGAGGPAGGPGLRAGAGAEHGRTGGGARGAPVPRRRPAPGGGLAAGARALASRGTGRADARAVGACVGGRAGRRDDPGAPGNDGEAVRGAAGGPGGPEVVGGPSAPHRRVDLGGGRSVPVDRRREPRRPPRLLRSGGRVRRVVHRVGRGGHRVRLPGLHARRPLRAGAGRLRLAPGSLGGGTGGQGAESGSWRRRSWPT